MRPKLPDAEALAPWLRRIDQTRWYSNFGPLENLLRQKLGEMAGLSADQAGLFSSGTAALHLALKAMVGDRPGLCLMPSWSHLGTAAAAVLAGMRPYFLDCARESWALDLDAVEQCARRMDVRAVVVVAPFGGKIDYEAWDDFHRRTSLPVIIDGAAAFDQFVHHGQSIRWGRTPVMVSLHATKVFGVGEGGLLLSDDPELMLRTLEFSNFGIRDDVAVSGAIGNFKLNEYNAAVGLAALDGWPERRALLDRMARAMRSRLAGHGLRTTPGFGGAFVSSTCMISAPGMNADQIDARLGAAGLGTRRWWRQGLHRIAEFADGAPDDLPVTGEIAQSFTGAPFYPEMPADTADRIVAALATGTAT